MSARICNKCEAEKPLAEFAKYQRRDGKYAYKFQCKKCHRDLRNEYRRKWRKRPDVKIRERELSKIDYEKNREKKIAIAKEYRLKHPDKIKQYRKENKDKINGYRRKHRSANVESYRNRSKKWYDNNQEKAIAYQKKFYENNKEKLKPIIAERTKKYREKNAEKCKARKMDYYYSHQKEIIEKERARYWDNPDKSRAVGRQRTKKGVDELSDTYIKNLIRTQTGIASNEIPTALIKISRLQIKAKRTIKLKQNEPHPTTRPNVASAI